jgi:MFS family permease
MAFDACSWLLFAAVLVNQAGRVMIPAIKTSVLVDKDFAPAFEQNVGAMLSGVSLVCLGGKLLGAALTDKLGGWLVLIAVFVMWIVATVASFSTYDVQVFGGAWLLNSFAYTVTWGAAVQVIGSKYSEAKERDAQLVKVASASRFGATFGNIIFGQLLTAGLHWRQALMPVVPLQVTWLGLGFGLGLGLGPGPGPGPGLGLGLAGRAAASDHAARRVAAPAPPWACRPCRRCQIGVQPPFA